MAKKRKIGVLTDCLQLGVREGVERAAEIGADGIQVYVTHGELYPDNLDAGGRRDFRDFVASQGLELSALVADFDWVKGFLDADHNRENIPRVKKCMDLAVDLGVKVVTMHIGKLPEHEADSVYQEALRCTRELCEYAEEREVILATETGPEPPQSLLEFLGKVSSDAVGVNYDPANFVMCGPFDHIGGVKILKDYIVHTHAKDGVCLGGGKFKDVPLGEGGVAYKHYLAALDEIGYDGYMTIEREEGNTRVTDITEAVAFLRSFEA